MNRFFAATALSLVLPLLLLATSSFRNGLKPEVAQLPLWGINWLFMAAPHLIVLALALWSEQFRLGLAASVLAILCAVLLVVQVWIWCFVPAREGALAWVLYIPAWTVVLLGALGWHLLTRARG